MTDLTKIPGIGKNMAQHLIAAGYPNIDSSKGKTQRTSTPKTALLRAFRSAVALCTAIGWRCITPTTTGSYRPTSKTGGIGRIEYGHENSRRYRRYK